MFEECEFVWYLPRKNGEDSEVFPKGETSTFKWKLRYSFPCFELFSVSAPAGSIKVTCKFSLGRYFRIMDYEFCGKMNDDHESIMQIELVTRDNEAFRNNTLIYKYDRLFCLNIWVHIIKFENKEKSTFDNYARTLLWSMLNNSNFCDLEIQCGSSSFKVHKSVFAEISPVFQAMFLYNMQENQSNSIVIKDFESDIVRKMIYFIYNGDVDVSDYSTVTELLKISDIYNIENLKCYCVNRAKTMITAENVMRFILQADLNNSPDLKSYAINYFIENMRTYSQDELKEIMKIRPDLLPELFSKISTHFRTIKY